MDSREWCRRHPLRRGQRPPWFQRPAKELQVFAEDALWFRRNSPRIEPNKPSSEREGVFQLRQWLFS
eukprot:8741107-Lingulodinium_polyedra.AAC.1